MAEQFLQAPELTGIIHWINTEPLTLQALRGKVIGLEFWTYSCGNCDGAVSEMNALFEKYRMDGFTLLGVHSPELDSDKELSHIQDYIYKKRLTFPIAVDNDMMTWMTYGQKYWPTLYLIDKQGRIRSRHIGEGGYYRIEQEIVHLLEE